LKEPVGGPQETVQLLYPEAPFIGFDPFYLSPARGNLPREILPMRSAGFPESTLNVPYKTGQENLYGLREMKHPL
jgi:hypothetical protein